jgi:hypothetical protein
MWTVEDFDRLSWHDNQVYAWRIRSADPDAGDWRSDLILDIDHIVEWVCGADRRPKFRVAPADLVFHDVTDLKIAIDWGGSGFQTGLSYVSIAGIERSAIADQKVCLDRPYYRWRIALNWPRGGEISFGASGFTQTLRADPVLCDEQWLPPRQRAGGAI